MIAHDHFHYDASRALRANVLHAHVYEPDFFL